MATITFDTRKAVRHLQGAGFSDAQADAMVDTLAEAFDDTVAAKADIAEVRAGLKADIAEVQADLKADIAEVQAASKTDIAELKAEIGRLEGRVFRALWIQGAGIVGLVVGLTKLL
jgi:uncharacterized protein involved in exopolysaccharide biosynthesis